MKHPILFTVCFMFILLLVINAIFPSEKKDASYQSPYTAYTTVRYDRYNKPPVNRTPPMSAEEAKRLSGTGYKGCRPNSFAENNYLDAAQLACKNCGYHTDNGRNSYCDYCQWMERYGGGLPSVKRETTTSATHYYGGGGSYVDPFVADDYEDPMDFYEDYADAFADYEEAEDYWEDYVGWDDDD